MRVMDKQIIERAVEAAAKADYEVLRRGRWDEQPGDFRDEWRDDVRPMVTAALAEVEASIMAQALNGHVCDEAAERAYRRCIEAESERDDLAARVARVEALHIAGEHPFSPDHCMEDGDSFPCPTIKALRVDVDKKDK